MKRPTSALNLHSGFPLIAILSVTFAFFAFLMLLMVQIHVTLPLEPGEISAWGGEDR